MKVKATTKYLATFIPPRCRKERQEVREIEVSANIREVKAEDAPVAFVVVEYGELPKMVRFHKNRLYRDNFWFKREYADPKDYSSDFHHRPVPLEETDWNRWLGRDYAPLQSTEEEAKAQVRKNASDFIIVDGILYKRCYEPYYSVTTFGLGNNHGGSTLSIGWLYKGAKHRELCPAIYPATKRDEAINAALTVAIGRGDNESVEHIRQGGMGEIHVLIPEASKFRFPKHDLYKWDTEEQKQRLIDKVNAVGGSLPYDNIISDVFRKEDIQEANERIKKYTGLDLNITCVERTHDTKKD